MVDVREEILNDPLGLGLPRADVPLKTRLVEKTKEPSLVDASLDTAHLHEMLAFYACPRVLLDRLGMSTDTLFMLVDSDDENHVSVLPVHGDPAVLKKVKTGAEVYRRPKRRSMDAAHVTRPDLDQVVMLSDAHGTPVGSIAALAEEGERGAGLSVLTHTDALRTIGVPLVKPRTEAQLSVLFAQADHVFGPWSEFFWETMRPTTIEGFLVLEDALRIMELLAMYPDDPDARKAVFALCRMSWGNRLVEGLVDDYGPDLAEIALASSTAHEPLLQLCDSRDELIAAAKLVKEQPLWLMSLCRGYNTLVHDTVTAGNQSKFLWEKPLENHVYRLGRDLIKAALFHHDDPGFSQEYLDASLRALHDTLNALHELDLPARIPREADMHGQLTDFTLQRAGDMVAMTVVAPVVEELMRLRLGNVPPGQMERATRYFYSVVGPALNANANRATGDTEKQRAVLEDIFQQLITQGRWNAGDVFVDLGSGDRKRIGNPFYDFLRQTAPPSHIFAVDAIQMEPAAERDVHVVQMALEDPALPMIHARHLGKQEAVLVDAAMMMWSVLNDIGPDKLQDVFNNVATMLRKRDGEDPGGTFIVEVPMGYVDELTRKAEALGQAAFPAAELHYPMSDGTTVDKPLSIVYAYEMLVRAMRAGLEPLNLPPGGGALNVVCLYDTQAGKKRAFFVFERVGDPEQTLDQVFVGSGRPDRRA